MKVTAQAPMRICYFGGGTDLPVYYRKYGGVVLNMAINLRQYIEINDYKIVLKHIRMPPKASEEFYKAFLEAFKVNLNIKAECDTDIESGLGSSASAAVALVGALSKLKNRRMSRTRIAERAWNIETRDLKLYGGKQDQYAAAFGGANVITFTKDGVIVKPIDSKIAEKLADNTLLFHVGENRKSTKIQEQLKKLTLKQRNALNDLKGNAMNAINSLHEGNMSDLGFKLAIGWLHKKESNPLVTTNRIDRLYRVALRAGAWGAKLCGSGGGGHMIVMAPKSRHGHFIRLLEANGARHAPFEIDWKGLVVK